MADQYVRVERLRRLGTDTKVAEDLLHTLQDAVGLLEQHLGRITGAVEFDKVSR